MMFRRKPRYVVLLDERPSTSPVDWEAIRSCSEAFALTSSPSSKVQICDYSLVDDGGAFGSLNGPRFDNGIQFLVELSKVSLSELRSAAHLELKDRFPDAEVNGEATSTVVASIIHREIALRADLLVLSNFISQSGRCDPLWFRAELITGERPHFFRSNRHNLAYAHVSWTPLGVRKLPLLQTLEFIEKAATVDANGKLSPFSRGLNYLMKAVYSDAIDATKMVWAISSIEALLTSPGEKISMTLVEERLRAVLQMGGDNAVGILRKLYKFRNDFLHGGQDIPIWIAGIVLWPDDIKNPKQSLGNFALSMDAIGLSLSVVQGLAKRRIHSPKFLTSLDGTPQL